MTCKDCIHYEVCGSLGMEVYRWGRKPTLQIFLDKYKAEHCTRFKTRSRFVELPFDVGDSYFEILATIDDKTAAIFEFHIDRIIQLKNAYGEPTEIFYEDRKAGRFQNALKPYNRRFRSREEAEQALKESEENAN